MDKIETIEEFYKRKFNWMPDNIKNEIGHFNVFRIRTKKTIYKNFYLNRGNVLLSSADSIA
jgi:hypothetical protein